MSIKRDRTKLKTYFETGDRPTEEEFAELIDSGINQKDDEIHVVNSEIDPDKAPNLKVGVGTDSPKEKLHVEGSIMTSGHLKGDMSNKQPNDKTLQIINDAQIQLYSKDHNSAPGRVVIGANKDSQDPNSGAMIFAKHLTQGGWEQNMIIDHDGNVGVGTSNPQNKLVVNNGPDQLNGSDNDTGLTLPTGKGAGKILTSNSDGKAFWRPATDVTNGLWIDDGNGNIRNGNSGSVKITANTLLVESQANNAHTWLPYTDGEIYLTGNEDGSGTGDIHFRSYSLNDGYKHHMVVKGDGNVGIGVNPLAKLDIVGKAENENGHGILKVGGAGTGKDLRLGVQGGNAPYTWIQSHGSVPLKLNPHPAGNTTTINENGGNVGVGVSAPTQKLDVNGSLQLEGDLFGRNNGGQFTIKSSKNIDGSYMHMKSSTINGNNQGGITFVATKGNQETNGFDFILNNVGESPGWPLCMRIDHDRNTYFNNNKIHLRGVGDRNHGLAWFGNQNTNHSFGTGYNIDGPVLYGNSGGALGSVQSNQMSQGKLAMQWFNNGNVDFKGKIRSNGNPLMVKKYYLLKPNANGGNSNHEYEISDYPPSKWEAFIGSFEFNHVPKNLFSGSIAFWINKKTGVDKWRLKAHFPNTHHNDKQLLVFFVRKELF